MRRDIEYLQTGQQTSDFAWEWMENDITDQSKLYDFQYLVVSQIQVDDAVYLLVVWTVMNAVV